MSAGLFAVLTANGNAWLVDRGLSPSSDDRVVVELGGELAVKRWRVIGGRAVLPSDVPGMPDYTPEDGSDPKVWGVVAGRLPADAM